MRYQNEEMDPEDFGDSEYEQHLIERMRAAMTEINNCWAEARRCKFNLRPWVNWDDKRIVPARTYRKEL